MTNYEPWAEDPNTSNEWCVLGSILHDNSKLADVREHVSPDDFRMPATARLYGVMCEMIDAGELCTANTLHKRIRSTDLQSLLGSTTTVDIMNAVIDGHMASGYARLLGEMGERFRRKREIELVQDVLSDEAISSKEALERAESLALSLLQRCGTTDAITMPEDTLAASKQQTQDAINGVVQPGIIKTGWAEVDGMTGGFKPGQLIVIAARPSIGKSSLMTTIAGKVALDDNLPVLIASMEVTAKTVIENIVTCRSEVDGRAVLSGQSSENGYSAWSEAAEKVMAAPILVDSSTIITGAHIHAMARRLAISEYIRLLMVDYLQLIMPDAGGRDQSREREVARMSAHLKAAAVEADIPVIALSQLNRLVESRGDAKPKLSDLRDSGAIEQDADVVIMLHTEGHGEDGLWSRKCLNVAKNRSGPTGEVTMYFHKPSLRFTPERPDGYREGQPARPYVGSQR